ncbi:MAG: Holliday junction branch migration protein RuvA [Clostridia bacterium]|jgi:Holliday junction DNA helicase RuvA|nr:Holliday junction branch migration protein RuvA [Clostridia bacterium]
MIGYLKGKILSLGTDTALIETAAGVGFEVLLSGSARGSLSGRTEGEVYTYLQVREDGVSLFGFSSLEEKEMFLKLISVSSVGPKMGIAALSQMSAGDIATAIATNDVKRLSAVKGMGKKTAERIILELREKVSAVAAQSAAGEAVPVVQISASDEDAVVALMTLGFTRNESAKAIARAREKGATEIEDIIRLALQGM